MAIKVGGPVFLVRPGSLVLAQHLETGFARISLEKEVVSVAQPIAPVGVQLEVRKPNSQKASPRPSRKVFQGEDPKT